MIDSIKQAADSTFSVALKGAGGVYITAWEFLPWIVRLGIGVATFAHICVRIRKDLK